MGPAMRQDLADLGAALVGAFLVWRQRVGTGHQSTLSSAMLVLAYFLPHVPGELSHLPSNIAHGAKEAGMTTFDTEPMTLAEARVAFGDPADVAALAELAKVGYEVPGSVYVGGLPTEVE